MWDRPQQVLVVYASVLCVSLPLRRCVGVSVCVGVVPSNQFKSWLPRFLFRWSGRRALFEVVAFVSTAKCCPSVEFGECRCVSVMMKSSRVGLVLIAWLAAGCASANAFLPPGHRQWLVRTGVCDVCTRIEEWKIS